MIIELGIGLIATDPLCRMPSSKSHANTAADSLCVVYSPSRKRLVLAAVATSDEGIS